MNFSGKRIGIIGLGYVGLPLAVEFAKKYPVLGFDIDHFINEEGGLGFPRSNKKQKININESGFVLIPLKTSHLITV